MIREIITKNFLSLCPTIPRRKRKRKIMSIAKLFELQANAKKLSEKERITTDRQHPSNYLKNI